MSHVTNDYENASTGGASSYAKLGAYHAHNLGVPFAGKVTKGMYQVPSWQALGYPNLTGSGKSHNGHPQMSQAYGSSGGSCQLSYSRSVCNSN